MITRRGGVLSDRGAGRVVASAARSAEARACAGRRLVAIGRRDRSAQVALALGALLGLSSGVRPARADGPAPRALTLGEARAWAERQAPALELARRRAEVAGAEIAVAGALPNPSLTLLTARQTARLSAGLSLPLPLLGQRARAVEAAQADADAAVIDGEVARVDARWGATHAWVDLWQAQERAALLARAAADAERLRVVAAERFDAGSAPRLDMVRAGAERARAAAESAAARAAVDAAGARLGPWLGEDRDTPLQAAGAPQPPAVLPELAELDARAAGHPLLRRDQAQVAAAARHVALEQRLRVPVPSAELTVNTGDPTLPGVDVIAGVAVEAPLLNRRGGAIDRAQRLRALAEATRAVDARQLAAALRDAWYATVAAAGRARALRDEALPAAEEARGMTEDGYREGRVDLLRLLEAQHALVDTGLATVEATAAWAQAVADLERASGVVLHGP